MNLLYGSGNSKQGLCINLEGWDRKGDWREVQMHWGLIMYQVLKCFIWELSCVILTTTICGRFYHFFHLMGKGKNCLELLFVQGHRGSEWEIRNLIYVFHTLEPVLHLTLKNSSLSSVYVNTLCLTCAINLWTGAKGDKEEYRPYHKLHKCLNIE